MEFTIIAVGSLKEKYLKEGMAEYSKRMSAYGKLTIIEVLEEKKNTLEESLLAEGRSILGKIREGSFVIALAIAGKSLDSVSLAEQIDKVFTYQSSQIIFIIGGSNGLSPEVLKRADFQVSFSQMTFPHQLMRLILIEQLYRSMKILKNEPYHK